MPESRGHLNPGAPGVELDRFEPEPALSELVRHVWLARWRLPPGEIALSYVFGLPDSMFMAAAHALADHVDAKELGESILPPLSTVREVGRAIAIAVGKAAIADGLAPACTDDELTAKVDAKMWQPDYEPYVAV